MRRILLIDDSDEMQLIVNKILGDKYNVYPALTGKDAISLADSSDFDLILLDLSLPDIEGFDLCNHFRSSKRFSAVPIIIISSRLGADAHASAYNLGADNYLEKPFVKSELIALVESKLKHLGVSTDRLVFGNLERDLNSMVARVNGENINLAPKEFLVLSFLLSNFDEIVARNNILDAVWNADSNSNSRIVDNHVNLLRRKLRESQVVIEGVYGKGYRAKLLRGEV